MYIYIPLCRLHTVICQRIDPILLITEKASGSVLERSVGGDIDKRVEHAGELGEQRRQCRGPDGDVAVVHRPQADQGIGGPHNEIHQDQTQTHLKR